MTDVLGWIIIAASVAFAATPWVLAARGPRGDEGTLDEWRRRRR